MEYNTEHYFVFYSENQGAMLWAIRKLDLSKNNPPVFETCGGETVLSALLKLEKNPREWRKVVLHRVERGKITRFAFSAYCELDFESFKNIFLRK